MAHIYLGFGSYFYHPDHHWHCWTSTLMQNITNVDVELIRQPKGPTWPTVHPPLNHYQVQYKRCAAKSFKCITNPLHWLPCQSLWLWLKCFGWQMFYQKDKLSAHILWDIFVTFSPRDLAQKNCHGDKLSGRQIVRIHFQFIQQSIFRSARTS